MVERQGEVASVVIDAQFWRKRRVFLTGHTGFKGGWMALVLRTMGAEVFGYALAPEHEAGIFCSAGIGQDLQQTIGDICDSHALRAAIDEAQPEVIIHMAAQSLVRLSYAEPVNTYATNVMGTVHLLESVRQNPSIRAVVIVTSDKCYENVGSLLGYCETDPLGGHDPYSNSKACAELITAAYRRSFFHAEGASRIASGRAGNVFGGGDWARDRLIPDIVRAFMAEQPVRVRNPGAVRPWQHVLDPILGYLQLAECLVQSGQSFAEGWNFGPDAASEVPVEHIVERLACLWGGSASWQHEKGDHPHEAAYLKLDCSKAQARMSWRPLLELDDALHLTVDWYRAFCGGADMRAVTLAQINAVLRRATSSGAAEPAPGGFLMGNSGLEKDPELIKPDQNSATAEGV